MLLKRPDYDPAKNTETINDKDGFVCNVWRALKFSPEETAKWCDWPVNHADLIARKTALIENEDRLLKNLCADTEWHDPKMAGYWIWAASCWIGTGLTATGKRPHICDAGKGVHATGQIPFVSHAGKGVNAKGQIPNGSNGVYSWFAELSARLRYVRVVCGEWNRVCGGNWQDKLGTVGIFFDPPYGVKDRDTNIYHHDSTDVAKDVLAWCKERGGKKTYRIVIAGYEEYAELLSLGWTSHEWEAGGGYSSTGKGQTRGKGNKTRERLYLSPHCLPLESQLSGDLFKCPTRPLNEKPIGRYGQEKSQRKKTIQVSEF